MKIISKYIEKDASGVVSVVPEESEDMWHLYNILNKGDLLTCSTVRKVVSETDTGSTDKSSVRINLTIQVTDVFFDTQAAVLRVNGTVAVENRVVRTGAYHTCDVEMNRPCKIRKQEWDIITLERLQEAADVTKRAEIAAVVMQEGLANICLLTDAMTLVRQKVETNVPKKQKGSTSHYEKGIQKFYHAIYQGISSHVDFNLIKVLILASPGFTKDAAYKYIMEQSVKENYRPIIENKSKIMLVHCSTGQVSALSEALKEPSVVNLLGNTKYAQESKTLEEFYRMLASEPARAFYGYDHVKKAADKGAIDKLLVADSLFRSNDLKERKRYIALIESIRAFGGTTLIFSSLHTSGETLNQLTGIAAILHFPCPDIEEEVEEEQEQKRLQELGSLAPRPGDEFITHDESTTL